MSSRRNFLTAAASLGASSIFLKACGERSSPPPGQSISAISPFASTMHVVNVLDFPTFQAAANAIGATGGILYFPEGTHTVSTPITILPNTWVLGAGVATNIVRSGAASSIFAADGAGGLRFSDLKLDVAGASGIALTNSSGPTTNVAIEHCTFASSTVGYAMVIEGCRGLWISENFLDHTDIYASSRSPGPGVYVVKNHLRTPRVGIALYQTLDEDVLDSCIIEDNIIEDPTRIGIHIGPQNEGVFVAASRGLIIRNNVIRWAVHNPPLDNTIGMLVRFAGDTRDWIIEGNTFSAEQIFANSVGMRLASEHPSTAIRSLAVLSNSFRNFDHQGITIAGSVSGLRISGNILEATRGIQLYSAYSGIHSTVIAGNIVRSNGLRVNAAAADVRGLLVKNNIFMNTPGWESAGIWLVAGAGRTVEADVAGNRSSDDQPTKTQYFGAKEEGAGTFDTRYVNNDFDGNLAGGLGPINNNAVVRDNRGTRTENSGTTAIGTSGVSAAIAHGLVYTPDLRDISLTILAPPGSWISANTGHVWIASIGAGNFTIQCAPAPQGAETLQVAWQAAVRSVEV